MTIKKEDIIINAALTCFANKGYAKTSIQDIANAANISKGSFYTYFENKEDLLIQLVKGFQYQLKAQFQTITESKDSLQYKFIQFVTMQLNLCYHNKDIIKMMLQDSFSKELEEVHKLLHEQKIIENAWFEHLIVHTFNVTKQSHIEDLSHVFEYIVKGIMGDIVLGYLKTIDFEQTAYAIYDILNTLSHNHSNYVLIQNNSLNEYSIEHIEQYIHSTLTEEHQLKTAKLMIKHLNKTDFKEDDLIIVNALNDQFRDTHYELHLMVQKILKSSQS